MVTTYCPNVLCETNSEGYKITEPYIEQLDSGNYHCIKCGRIFTEPITKQHIKGLISEYKERFTVKVPVEEKPKDDK